MPDDDSVLPLPEHELEGVTESLFEMMALLQKLSDKGISARAFTTALIYTLQSSFEAMKMEKLAVKNVLQHIINTYDSEAESEES